MKVTTLKKARYDASVFQNVETIDEAVSIILTPEEGMTSEQRWKTEAPILMKVIERFIRRGSLVLDYGCGIGRLSKPLIEKDGCEVVGVDISANMRALAASCVQSERFFALPPEMLKLIEAESFDGAIAVWTLQHCVDPKVDVENIATAVKKNGNLVLVNNVNRVVPTDTGHWVNDGVDVRELIEKAGFALIEEGGLEPEISPGWMRTGTYWAAYARK